MQVDLSNLKNITSPHFYPCYSNRKKFQIYWGSQGSGKSYFIASKIILRILTDDQQHRVLVMRKIHDKIRESVFNLFVQVIRNWNLSSLVEITSTPFSIKFPAFNNSEIIFSGVDDSEKLKSINNVTGAWLEETTEFNEDDLDQVIDRIRSITKYPHEIYLSFNPVSEKHWIKKKFFDSDNLKLVSLTHHSTWRNNPFVHPDYGSDMIKRYKNNPNAYRVRVEGLWGNDDFGGECYHKFNIGVNCAETQYDPDGILLLSFDFNTMPHSSLLIGQLKDNQLNVIDEITLQHPYNRPADLCKTFIKKYSDHKSGIWVTGDSSGKNESTRSEAGTNDYTTIFESLKNLLFVKDYVPSKNTNVVQRLEFINTVFANDVENCTIVIDNNKCSKLIEDLTFLKTNNEGGKLKQRVKDKKTGASYERLGHLSDCLDYMVTIFLKAEFKNFIRGGDLFLSVGSSYISSNLF